MILALRSSGGKQRAFGEAVRVLKEGGVVVLPTDTVYGIAANIFSGRALAKLFKIKMRREEKPSPIFIRNLAMARTLAAIPKTEEKVLQRLWPGPLTAVLPSRARLPRFVSRGGTVALRVPRHPFVSALLRRVPFPITGTSANISGLPPCRSAKAFLRQLKRVHSRTFPDLIVDAGRLRKVGSSTILDLTTQNPVILRKGPITKKKLERYFKCRIDTKI